MEKPQSPNLKDQLDELVNAQPALLRRRGHPTLPLLIYNYTTHTLVHKKWTLLTELARGLVIEQNTGNIIARPMLKFHDYEDRRHRASSTDPFTVLEKVDGSLGIWFCYKGQWIMATRGSFTSPQAQKGLKIAVMKGLHAVCDPSKTYCFEIIHPEHRIVLNYGERSDLVLLAVIDRATGCDTTNNCLPQIAEALGITCARSFQFPERTLEQISQMNLANQEGFVIRYDTTGERVKLKFPKYNAFHAIMGNPNEAQPKVPKTKKLRRVAHMMQDWLLADPEDRIEPYLDMLPECLHDVAMKAQQKFDLELEKTKKEFDEWKMKGLVVTKATGDAHVRELWRVFEEQLDTDGAVLEKARTEFALGILRKRAARGKFEMNHVVKLALEERAKMKLEERAREAEQKEQISTSADRQSMSGLTDQEKNSTERSIMLGQWLELAGIPCRAPGAPS